MGRESVEGREKVRKGDGEKVLDLNTSEGFGVSLYQELMVISAHVTTG